MSEEGDRVNGAKSTNRGHGEADEGVLGTGDGKETHDETNRCEHGDEDVAG